MPQIPLQSGPQIAPEIPQGGELNAQVTPGETGGAIAQGAEDAGRGITDVAMAIKQKVDTIQSLNADTALGSQINDSLWGPNGVTSAKGATAAARMEQATKDVAAKQQQIANGLTNSTQRIQFMQASKQRMEWFQRIGGNHVAQQTEQANQDAYVSQLGLANANVSGLIANHGANDVAPLLEHEAQSVRDTVAQYGKSTGMNAQQLDYHQRAALTQFHDNVVETMLKGGQVAEAKAWYDTHADEMMPGKDGRDAVGAKVNAAVQVQMIDHKVDAAMETSRVVEDSGQPGQLSGAEDASRIRAAQNGGSDAVQPQRLSDTVDGGKAYAVLLQDPELKANPQLMAKATDQLTARLHVQAEQQKAADNAMASPIMAEVEQSRGVISADLGSRLEGVPDSVRRAVLARAKEVTNPPNTDVVASARIHAFISDNPDAFARLTPLELNNMVSGYLNPADRSDVVKSWQEARKAMQNGKEPGSVLTADQEISATFRGLGIEDTSVSGAKRMDDARRALNDWSIGQARTMGKAPSPTDLHNQLIQIIQRAPVTHATNPADVPGPDVLADPARRAAWADQYAARRTVDSLTDNAVLFAPQHQQIANAANAMGLDVAALPTGQRAALEYWWGQGRRAAVRRDDAGMTEARNQIRMVLQRNADYKAAGHQQGNAQTSADIAEFLAK